MTRSAFLSLVFALALAGLSAPASGQTKEELDELNGKISNDSPARPLQMPPASTETKEAIDDFDRFQRRGAWERALKSLYTIPEDQARRFIDGEQGFIIPIERKRRLILSSLPPNGQAACRLLYDSEAKKLLDEATGTSELKNLEKVYSAYFVTSVGDNAADRLGDLYFEQGHFDHAADCWLAVLRERPDTDLSPALLAVKAAVALHRAGRRQELEQIRSDLTERYSDEKVTVGGQTGPPREILDRLIGNEQPGSASGSSPGASNHAPSTSVDLSRVVDPVWQLKIAQSIEAGMTPVELSQWESTGLSAAVPAVAVEGTRLFVNFLGSIFAVDLESGKMLWRTSSFHNLDMIALNNAAQMVDTTRFGIAAAGDLVWTVTRDLKDQNYLANFQLICRRADNGEIVWKSADFPDYADVDLVSHPLVAGGKLLIAAKATGNGAGGNNGMMMMGMGMQQGQPRQVVLGIQPHDGRLIWRTDVGVFREGNNYYWYGYNRDSSPMPRLAYRSGAVYLDTHIGVFARIDAETGTLDWGYGYKTEPIQGQRWFFTIWDMMQQNTATTSSEPLPNGEAFLIKGGKSDRLASIEPNRMKVLWDRPIAKTARMVGIVDQTLFLGGAEICALDLTTKQLRWATQLPGASNEARVLVRPDGLWQLTPRGIFELDPRTGDLRRIFRGNDLGAAGGDLYLTDQLLLAVSNRTISAYPRRAPPMAANGAAAPLDSPTNTNARASR